MAELTQDERRALAAECYDVAGKVEYLGWLLQAGPPHTLVLQANLVRNKMNALVERIVTEASD